MTQENDKCQKKMTQIRDICAEFEQGVNDVHEESSDSLSLSLNRQQMALLFGIKEKAGSSYGVIYAGSLKEATDLTKELNTWSVASNANETWHLISDELSESEKNGQIVSGLSKTMHAFLQRSSNNHFVIPEQLATIDLPDLEEYQQRQITLHAGERKTLRELTTDLVKAGYTRHENTIETAGFRVSG